MTDDELLQMAEAIRAYVLTGATLQTVEGQPVGFGSFTLLFGYLGYLVLAIPIGIIGLAIFSYDLATCGKQHGADGGMG